MPNFGDWIRKAKVVGIAVAFALLGVGFLVGVLAAKWVG